MRNCSSSFVGRPLLRFGKTITPLSVMTVSISITTPFTVTLSGVLGVVLFSVMEVDLGLDFFFRLRLTSTFLLVTVARFAFLEVPIVEGDLCVEVGVLPGIIIL